MKRLSLILLVAVVSCACYAQRVKVHQGNNINSFHVSLLDSITFHKNEILKFFCKNQVSEFFVNNVDSISINGEVIDIYNILPEQLNGWDEGIFSTSNNIEDLYMVLKGNKDEDGAESVVICINSFANEDLDETVNFLFDMDGNLQEIITSGYEFKAQQTSDEYIFVVLKDGEYVESFNVPSELYISNSNINSISSRRRQPFRDIFFNSKGQFSLPKFNAFLERSSGVLKNSYDAQNIIGNLGEGKYSDILLDLLVGGLVGVADLPLFAGIIAEKGVEDMLKHYYEKEKERYLGNAGIEITSIKRTDNKHITVEGTLSDLSSIPPTYSISSNVYGESFPNVVYWGVAESKSGQPGYILNEECSWEQPITGDKFSYTFYIPEEPGQTLYFRPFLVPKDKLLEIRTIPNPFTCFRYGERKEYIDMNVELSNFKQTKCNKDATGYQVQFTIDGRIPGIFNGLSGWGIYVKTPNGPNLPFYAKESSDYYPPTEKTFTCNIRVDESEIRVEGTEKVADVTITPFYSLWNELGLSYLESEVYTITINNGLLTCPDSHHPHAIDLGLPSGTKWCCCNVGASTPEGYGGYYAWGETSEKSYYEVSTYKYAVIDDNNGYWYYNGHHYRCTSIGSDIAGTSYDVARVRMGAPWRMPSHDQLMELMNNCSHQWTQQNGVNGFLMTGPSGGQIFLPAAGVRVGDELRRAGSEGYYWSSWLYSDYGYYALDLLFRSDRWENWYWNSRYCGLSVRAVRP